MAVSVAILEVIEKDGLTGVTHSKVARKSNVSRAWIYEYVGNEKGALISHAAEVLASHFARVRVALPKNRAELEKQLREGIEELFEITKLNPIIIKIYFRFRGTANPIGVVIQKYEKQWLDSAAKVLTEVLKMPAEQASLLAELGLTLRLGFAHRYATSSKAQALRERSKKIFDYVHSLLSGS